MKKLLVTGASGFLGWNICTVAQSKWNVVGVSLSHDIPIEGILREKCDITDFSALDSLFSRIKPDAVIHAAALSDPNFCETNVSESSHINVDASEHIARLCNSYGSRCAFTSTDLVFDGKASPYSEQSICGPLSKYGEQKVEAEMRMRSAHEAMLICRLPLMFGDHPGPAKSFIQPMIDNFLKKTEMSLFVDEFRTPVSGRDAALGILLLLENHSGVFHLGGKTSISRYDFGQLLGKCLNLKSNGIHPVAQKDVKIPARRPKDVSLDSSKAYSIGYNPDTPEIALKKLECVQRSRHIGFPLL
jgi:dTDP-4-dehydrorhamnose reductase